MRIQFLCAALLGLVLLALQVDDGEALYPYAVKGFVKDVRHKPHLFIGAWALKKFLKLKLIKFKFHLLKKLVVKKTIKAGLVLLLLKKLKGRFLTHHLGNRGKRQVQDFVPYSPSELEENYEYYDYQDLPGREPSDDEMMAYLQMANEIDTIGCLPKGVCEVIARGNNTQMNHFESMVYDIYGKSNNPLPNKDSPSFQYEYAAQIGKTSKDVRACEQMFPQCPEQPQKLNQFMEKTFTSEMCDFPDDQITSHSDRFFYATAEPPGDFRFQPHDLQPDSQFAVKSSGTYQPSSSRDFQQKPSGRGNIKFDSK